MVGVFSPRLKDFMYKLKTFCEWIERSNTGTKSRQPH